MRKSVHFGAGNIGRGFLGQLYFESGYATTFVESRENIVSSLNSLGSYEIKIAESTPTFLRVENVSAILATDQDAINLALAEAEIVSTAVGVNVLARIAPTLAEGIVSRLQRTGAPLDILVCENQIHANQVLKADVLLHIPTELKSSFEEKIGFVETSIGRMVPTVSPEHQSIDPLFVAVEAYCKLPVDGAAFKAPLPKIPAMTAYEPFSAVILQKLFIHNAGHAVAAYLGWIRKYKTIDEAVRDRAIFKIAREAMMESATAIHRQYDLELSDLEHHVDDLLKRFANSALGDQIIRVGADPLRKLGPEDRLMGAIKNCMANGVQPNALCIGVLAALQFDHVGDPSAIKLRCQIESIGVPETLMNFAQDRVVVSKILSQTLPSEFNPMKSSQVTGGIS